MSFSFDERAIKKLVDDAVRDTAKEAQSLFDSVESRKGKPVSQVKSRLRAEASRKGFKFTEPGLTDYAKAISEGTKITVRPKKS